MHKKFIFILGLLIVMSGMTATTYAQAKTKMEKYVEQTLKLVPLKLPEEDLLPDDEAVKALKGAIVLQAYFPDGRFGPGKVVVAFDPEKNRALFMAVSPSMIRHGMKKTQVIDDGLKMYSSCWNKPTTAGVAGCVVDKFTQWASKKFFSKPANGE